MSIRGGGHCVFGPKFIPGHWSHVLPRWLGISGPMSFPGGLSISGPMSFPGGWISHHMSFPGGRVSLGVVSREYGTPYTTHPAQRRPLPRLVCILLECFLVLITTRRQSLRRLCFYRCLSVHRGSAIAPGQKPPPA